MDVATKAQVNAILEQIQNEMSAIEGCSKDIDQVAESHRRRVEEVTKDVVETDDSLWTYLSMELDEIIERTAVEKEREKKLTQYVAKKKQTKTGLNQKVHNLSEQVNEVRRQIKDELEQFERLQEVVKVDQNRVFTREAFIEQRERRQEKKFQAEQRVIYNLQSLLGVKVEPVEDQSLQFTFNGINESDPDAQCKLTVSSPDGKSFQPVRCSPMIPEFERLGSALQNQQIWLPRFLRDMRQGFVRHVNVRGRR